MESLDTINQAIQKYACKLVFVDQKHQLVNFVPPKTVKVIHVYPSMPKLSLVRKHILEYEKEGLLELP